MIFGLLKQTKAFMITIATISMRQGLELEEGEISGQ